MLSRLAALILAAGLSAPAGLFAGEHVIGAAELQQRVRDTAAKRQSDVAKVRGLLSSRPAANALRSAGLDPVRVEKAVPLLDDDELARLAARSDKIQADFAAGALTNEQLTYIVIALVTAIVVVLIVYA